MNYLVKVMRQATREVVSQYVASDEISRTVRELFPENMTGLYIEIIPLDYRTERMFGSGLRSTAKEENGPLKGMLKV